MPWIPLPKSFPSWLEMFVKEVPEVCPSAKVEVGDSVEVEGREGRKIYVDTSLPGLCVNCTVIAAESPHEIPEIRIDGSTSTVELWGSNPTCFAIQLLNDLVRFHFFGKLKAREHSDFLVTEEHAYVESHEDVDDDEYTESAGYPKSMIYFVVTTPSNCYRIGLALLCSWAMDTYNFSVWTGGHFLVRSKSKIKRLDEQEVIDVIVNWDREHTIPLLPRLQAFLAEKDYIGDVCDDGQSPPSLEIDLGDGCVASLELGAEVIRYIPVPDWHMGRSICTPVFLKQADLMKTIAGLTFEKLRAWKPKSVLTELESLADMTITFDPV